MVGGAVYLEVEDLKFKFHKLIFRFEFITLNFSKYDLSLL